MMEESKIDEIISSLSTSAKISLEDENIFLIHPRYAQYKNKAKTKNTCQEERRKEWLKNQKKKRLEALNVHRGTAAESKVILERMEIELTKRKFYKKILKSEKPYKDWIMMSEWLVDVPDELQKDWICTICPEGKRVLIVSEKGNTYAYSRRGGFLMKFPSVLPGGCVDRLRGNTVLDCIWHYQTKTFFLLDVLIWGIPLTNCEAELRFFWLSNKFSEIPELMEYSSVNRHKFSLLQHNSASQLQEMLSIHPPFENNFPKVDGILFYHKDALYTGGISPLVTWLKPFMIPDILNIPVAQQYINEKPSNYPNEPDANATIDMETHDEDPSHNVV